jgi:hypothetical protein
MMRSPITLPYASCAIAVARMVSRTSNDVRGTVTITDLTSETGAGTGELCTTTSADPLIPSTVATILVLPADTAVIAPVGDTVAIEGFVEDHDTACPLIGR